MAAPLASHTVRYLMDLADRLNTATPGEKTELMDAASAQLGRSRATVYRWLRTYAGWTSTRRPRADRGSTRLPDASLEFVAALKQSATRANGKLTMPTPVAMNV